MPPPVISSCASVSSAEQQAAQPADHTCYRDGEQGVQFMRAGQEGEGIGADGEQSDMADRKLPCEADHEVEADDQYPVDPDELRQMQLIEVADPEGQGGERHAAGEKAGGAGWRAGVRHTARTCRWPKMPSGLSSRTTISRPTAMVC